MDAYLRDELRVLEREKHASVLANHTPKVDRALDPVVEAEPEAMPAEVTDGDDVVDVLRHDASLSSSGATANGGFPAWARYQFAKD